MIIELKLLAAAVAVGLVYWGADVSAATRQLGSKWNMGNREATPELTGAAGRIRRAWGNFRETFGFFAVALIAAVLADKTGPLTAWGAWLYVVARAVYLPVYALGIVGLRSAVFTVGFVGVLLILAALFV